MKLNEVLEDQIDEKLSHTLAAGAIALGSLTSNHLADHKPPHPTKVQIEQIKAHQQLKKLAGAVKEKYHLSDTEAHKIVEIAQKFAKPTFPKAPDILSIIGIESSFKPESTSNLKHDPAVGLMQVRPNVWGIDKENLKTPEQQVKFGSEILHKYYEKLGSEEKAVHAYNVGITNFKKGAGLNPGYVRKFNRERKWLEKHLKKT